MCLKYYNKNIYFSFFSFEFTGYFLDRNNRIPAMKINLEKLVEANKKLSIEQEELKKMYMYFKIYYLFENELFCIQS